MTRLKVNVLGVCETSWISKGQNDFQSDDYRVIHSGGESHERGVGIILDKERAKCVLGYWLLSDRVMLLKLKGIPFNLAIIMVYAPTTESSEEEIDNFYPTLDHAKAQCRSQEVVIIMGDLNAKVGKGEQGDMVGKFGLGNRNDRGERWI